MNTLLDKSFAIVVSEFNQDITEALLSGALSELQAKGISLSAIRVFKVPGAVEIPFTVKLLAKTNHYAAILCLGAVIRGETNHYDYVCQQVSMGIQQVMLSYDVPVIFGVLTTETWEQAKDRVGGKAGHKGKEAALAAIKMAQITNQIGV